MEEPTDDSPEADQQHDAGQPETAPRPWGPGSPAPGTPVASYGVGRDESATPEGSTATALYEGARFPDLEDVAPAGRSGTAAESAGDGQQDDNGQSGGLRILGVSAPKEIAGPVLAALALGALLYGWRRRRRRRW